MARGPRQRPLTGLSAFRAFLLSLPDQVAEAERRGQPIVVDDPGTEHGRRLLDTLGVTIAEPSAPAGLAVKAEHVPEAFRARVAGELRDARGRALELMPLPTKTYVRRGDRWDPDRILVVRYSPRGLCGGCFVPKDDRTPGCRTCNNRHGWRAWNARWRAALDKPPTNALPSPAR